MGSGIVAWEIHNSSLSPDLLEQVDMFINDEYGDEYFNGTWMVVGFWEDLVASEVDSDVSFTSLQQILCMCSLFRITHFKPSWLPMAHNPMPSLHISVEN